MTRARPTQVERLVSYMLEHGSVTVRDAMNKLDINSLRARLSDLRMLGYEYDSADVKYQNRWGEKGKYKRYYLTHSPIKQEQTRINVILSLLRMASEEKGNNHAC